MSINSNPFECCSKLTDIQVSPDHPYLALIDGVLFSKPDKRLICYPCAFTESEYTIPQGIQIIGDFAFYNCTSLISVTIPDSVVSIGKDAFGYCSFLEKITIPDSVESIEESAFWSCSSVTAIVGRNSYARQYCKDFEINYTYPDINDWLND